jgi:hypothetical protein
MSNVGEDFVENIILEAEDSSHYENTIDIVPQEPSIPLLAQAEEASNISTTPKLIFIVPYRDRAQQQKFFASHMNAILEDVPKNDYKIYYVHQKDDRSFNRGAMRNIGFLVMKEKYPNDYKNITFVFNDVDTMPFTKNFLNYETVHGSVKHFYGFTFALGGIVSIKGNDFEKVGGYPNFWAWGYEDNLLQSRVHDAKINIDRSQYYPIMDKNIFQMKDGLERIVNRSEFDRFLGETLEGFSTITNIQYNINEDTGFIDVTYFTTTVDDKPSENVVHNLLNGNKPFKQPLIQLKGSTKRRPTMKMMM